MIPLDVTDNRVKIVNKNSHNTCLKERWVSRQVPIETVFYGVVKVFYIMKPVSSFQVNFCLKIPMSHL